MNQNSIIIILSIISFILTALCIIKDVKFNSLAKHYASELDHLKNATKYAKEKEEEAQELKKRLINLLSEYKGLGERFEDLAINYSDVLHQLIDAVGAENIK